jgi:hypothetical protein
MKKIVSLLLIISFVAAGWAFALDIKKLAHSDKELKILVLAQKNKAQLNKLAAQPELAKILVLQIPPAKLTPQEIQIMQNWTKAGGSLWFYDSRLASYFDLHNAPLSRKEFENKDFKGAFGDEGKLPGVATVATTIGNHSLLSGVSSVAIFLLEIEPGKYSALEIEPSMIPLLKVNTENKAVSAIKTYGKGWVVFKPLLWEEELDGARFQLNLKEFSAGYPVPTIEKIESGNFGNEDNAAQNLDKVYLKNGKVISGNILTETYDLETEQGRLSLKKNQIAALYIQNQAGLDKIELKDGKLAIGYLFLGDELNIKEPSGKTLNLNKSMISKVVFKTKESSAK